MLNHNGCAAGHARQDEDLLELQRRMAERGIHLRLPDAGPGWELPELIEVEGELPSEALIRLRRATRV